MADFVCAVRGGPGSYESRLAALRRAERVGATAHFISVIDPATYGPLHRGELAAIRKELTWRDLAINRATATRAGIADVSYTVEVRVGDILETLSGYAREREADAILIGAPRRARDAAFGDALDDFVDNLRAASGVAVLVGAEAGNAV